LTSFEQFGLAGPIARAVADIRHTIPTPIQSAAIPLVLGGRDLIGIAQTGTGKTAAFALPILHRLAEHQNRPASRACRVLVLSPTRELSGQIADSFAAYGRHLRLKTALAIGGVPIKPQSRALAAGVDVLVATPGRLLDLANTRAVRLDCVEVLVLDEADRMLDMGFIHDIRTIVAKLPSKRQTLLFSATMPRAIADLAGEMLRDPARVAVTPAASTADRIDQRVVFVDRATKPALLAEVLRDEPINRALVFTRTKHGADKVVRGLAKAGIAAEAIHGNKSQNQRERVLAAFRDGRVRTLVATDIAARGIDVVGISHVVNYDLPHVAETYIHRIGRTARAGAEGIAISLCDADERVLLRDIERLIRTSIPATQHGGAMPRPEPRESHRDQRPRRSGRSFSPPPLHDPIATERQFGHDRHELAAVPFLQPKATSRGMRPTRIPAAPR
jgi:ATP-dependent RNA helicase RhlE